jgi:FtsH-binding integral membrane protein
MREAPSQSKNFHRVMKSIYGFLALAFFFFGAAYLSFWVWVDKGTGSQLWFGYVIFALSVGIPWGLGFWFFRLAMKKSREPQTEENRSPVQPRSGDRPA